MAWLPFPGTRFQPEDDASRVLSPLTNVDDGLLLDDALQFIEDGQFRLMDGRGRVVEIEEKRISLSKVEQCSLVLDDICKVVALLVSRGGRQGVGVLLVPNGETQQRWLGCGGEPQELTWRRSLLP